MTDCLLIGFNDYSFPDYARMVSSMGLKSGAYRDLNLAFITLEKQPLRSMDVLNRFYAENKGDAPKPFHNADFLWPVISYLGTYLQRRGFSFDYVNLPHLERKELQVKLQRNDILTIVITTTLYVSPHPILDLISFIREHNKEAKIIVGGPFIANQPKLGDLSAMALFFEQMGADIYVISNEGEATLVNILRNLKSGRPLNSINNIVYRQEEKYEFTASAPESNSLEDNMVDYGLFQEGINEFVTLRTAKSCPFSCSFCGFPQRAGKYRYMTVELVEKELNAIRDLGGVTTLTFIDDTFNVPKERFRELLKMMIRNNYGFKWNSFYRSDHGDGHTIELMAKAGCEGVFLGVESGSDAMLARMNKTARQKHYRTAIPLLQAAGISTHANVIIGFPGETLETAAETEELIEEAKPDFFRAQLWYADPITPIWSQREDYRVTGSAFTWSHATMDSTMACDLIDRMFLSIKNSVWLPQNGFEQWSTFYLQRKGMQMGQIKDFLKCFNAAIREKLLYPDREDVSPELIAALRQTAQFDRQFQRDMQPVEALGNYAAAEKFVANVFKSFRPLATGERDNNHDCREKQGFASGDRQITCAAVEKSAAAALVDFEDVFLAAYSIFIFRFGGEQDFAVLATKSGGGLAGAVALRISAAWDMTLVEFLQYIHGMRRITEGYGRYLFYILSSSTLTSLYDSKPVVFRFGFHYAHGQHELTTIEQELKEAVDVCKNLAVVLDVRLQRDSLTFKITCPEAWQVGSALHTIESLLVSVFENAIARRLTVRDLALAQGRADVAVQMHATEVFNF